MLATDCSFADVAPPTEELAQALIAAETAVPNTSRKVERFFGGSNEIEGRANAGHGAILRLEHPLETLSGYGPRYPFCEPQLPKAYLLALSPLGLGRINLKQCST
jgi:hypothetical protein